MFNRLPPRVFLGSFYLFLLAASGQKGQVSGFCYCVEVQLPFRWCEWASAGSKLKLQLHLNRGLCGTFLTEKLLSLAILTLFPSNIFLAILGYMEISQYHSWCMSRPLHRAVLRAFLTGLKGIETNVAQGIFWNMTGKKNNITDLKRIRNSSSDQNQIFRLEALERFGYLFVSYWKAVSIY